MEIGFKFRLKLDQSTGIITQKKNLDFMKSIQIILHKN